MELRVFSSIACLGVLRISGPLREDETIGYSVIRSLSSTQPEKKVASCLPTSNGWKVFFLRLHCKIHFIDAKDLFATLKNFTLENSLWLFPSGELPQSHRKPLRSQ
jgi:hypothetical protein